MNVNLTPELESLVEEKVKSGRYNSASEVVRDALRMFQDQEQLRELQIQTLQRKIDEGWTSLKRGKGIDGDKFSRELEDEENKLTRKRKRA